MLRTLRARADDLARIDSIPARMVDYSSTRSLTTLLLPRLVARGGFDENTNRTTGFASTEAQKKASHLTTQPNLSSKHPYACLYAPVELQSLLGVPPGPGKPPKILTWPGPPTVGWRTND